MSRDAQIGRLYLIYRIPYENINITYTLIFLAPINSYLRFKYFSHFHILYNQISCSWVYCSDDEEAGGNGTRLSFFIVPMVRHFAILLAGIWQYFLLGLDPWINHKRDACATFFLNLVPLGPPLLFENLFEIAWPKNVVKILCSNRLFFDDLRRSNSNLNHIRRNKYLN